MKDDLQANSIRTIEEIIEDLILALDDAIATYKVIENIKKDDSKPNQLLFCHIINGFDSFVYELLEVVILSDQENLKTYLDEQKKFDEKASLKDIIEIHEKGIFVWMQNQVGDKLENDINKKRHAQKLEMLLDKLGLNCKKIFVYLMGSGEFSSGYLKNTPVKKKTINHKTTSEEIIGYADVLYEKRNAVTHNRNSYQAKTLERLNQTWALKIENLSVIIKTDTIKSLIRFYTSVGLRIIDTDKIKSALGANLSSLKEGLEKLRKIEPLVVRKKGEDNRFINGGIKKRKELLKEFNKNKISVQDYMILASIDSSTARRDIAIYTEEGLLNKEIRTKRNEPTYYKISKK